MNIIYRVLINYCLSVIKCSCHVHLQFTHVHFSYYLTHRLTKCRFYSPKLNNINIYLIKVIPCTYQIVSKQYLVFSNNS